jgi:uncharacterized protein
MPMYDQSIRVVETGERPIKNPIVITGFPDVGLVGTIAVTHIIDALGLLEIGYIESELLPPIVVVHNRYPKAPVRVYGDGKIVVIVSEIPIPLSLVNPLSKSLVDWFEPTEIKLALLLGGIPHPNRLEIESPEVYGVCSSDATEKILEENNIKFLEEGFIVGPHGVILRECMGRGVPSIYLMSEAHYGYPDPGAAASTIMAANKILDLEIDVKALLEKGEEIRIKTRDLMRRTQETMKAMRKAQEQEMPLMYG